ncbi:cobalamin biosynthesis protein CobW [Amorphoplanes auranticolor]|uniref:Cobalamin biosynthesis protein CobW n=2 Tax=Actinoplanes auranticolor TaxID=47988 RepID=A0A919SLN7_9ACTN|nr:cobalamin biosynthesis protein CobW [Actinoplanes auranticolor]
MVCGFWPHATAEAAQTLLDRDPTLRLLHYETSRPGVLSRHGSGEIPAAEDPAAVLLADLATVAPGGDASGRLVIVPESLEPDQIRTAWQAQRHPGTLQVITVVPADLALDGLTDETDLCAVGLHHGPADGRSIGDLVARQLEQADTALLAGQPEGDAWEAEQLRVLLQRIAPWSQHQSLDDVRLPSTGRLEPVAPLTRGLRGHAVGVHEPVAEHGVTACVFHARRPFHPERLHDALDEITGQVVRSRGHFWLAARPDLVLSWESAGGLSVGPVSGWLADVPGEHWAGAGAERCLAAAVDWDPYYGDRHQHLAFIGVDLDPVRLHRTLASCLLTDHELCRGEEAWRSLPDPFSRTYPSAAPSCSR